MLTARRTVGRDHIIEHTLDDLMRVALDEVRRRGEHTDPSRGAAKEIRGVVLELTNPRARLSSTETRGKLFSALGEFCWYLAGSDDLRFIEYYIKAYRREADGTRILGAYGPRLFDKNGVDQVRNVLRVLKDKNDSRQAVIQIFDAADLERSIKSVPCTCTLHFMLRGGRLHLIAHLRSSDVYLGLPHDVFCFTMLQEILTRQLSAELGVYKHSVGSLHLYDEHEDQAAEFLAEGWQRTTNTMPPMPEGDPWAAVDSFLKAESEIRLGGRLSDGLLIGMHSYWRDLTRLLLIYSYKTRRDWEQIRALRGTISEGVYFPFIDAVLENPAS